MIWDFDFHYFAYIIETIQCTNVRNTQILHLKRRKNETFRITCTGNRSYGFLVVLQVVLLNLLATSAPLRTKASAVLLKASMNRLPLRFTQTLQRTARTRQKSRLSRICTLGLRSTWLRCLPALPDRVRTLSTVLQAKDDSMDAFDRLHMAGNVRVCRLARAAG